ncbi:MAG: 16S rRNA (guanine(966)-N(2))-methyltransferase RsmD [Desulfovibrionales bacterium]
MRIIAGKYRGRTLLTGSGPGYRPATAKVREAVFSMLESRGLAWEGVRVLDLYAGSGSLGLECLSRGASAAWFVEKNKKAAGIIRRNIETLGIDPNQARVVAGDLFPFLEKGLVTPFQVVFIDPPYGLNLLSPTLKSVLRCGWLDCHGFVIAETESSLQPKSPEELEKLVEKNYGQTGIHIWKMKEKQPSTREHSIRSRTDMSA